MTPEAVIYRYLAAASRRPVAVDQLVTLIAADADLLGRWLNLLACPAEPDVFVERMAALSSEQLRTLAQAQAWAVLPVAGSARLGMDQWQAVLRSAFLAEVLAGQLGLENPQAVRWRVLLAVSGVNLEHDPEARELAEFRGVRPELLQDAGLLIKVFSVVDALEVLDQFRAAQLAESLLDIAAGEFGELVRLAGERASELTERLALDVDLDADWAYRLWIQQQVSMLSELLGLGSRLVDLNQGHDFATRSLFHQVPLLLYRDARNGLAAVGFPDVRIALDSPVSRIAAAVRDGELQNVSDSPETAVADRQLLRRIRAEEALCVPLLVQTRAVGALLFQVDEDMDYELPLAMYAEQLAQRLDQLESRPDEGMELAKRYRQREEKRLRELVHEINNPLSVVYNYLHILELRLQHEPSAREQVQMIGSELKRAGEILQRVRELPPVAEVEPAGEASFADADVNDLARRVFELHRGYADDHEVELQLELCHGALVVTTDEQRLAQVLNNLTRNAIEASAEESVCIGSAFGVFREGREGVELFVRDTGPGLPREVLERLAEPKESTKGGDHAGLGLHIVHRLVGELHGGIDVRTAPGVGTTFTIFLPLKPL